MPIGNNYFQLTVYFKRRTIEVSVIEHIWKRKYGASNAGWVKKKKLNRQALISTSLMWLLVPWTLLVNWSEWVLEFSSLSRSVTWYYMSVTVVSSSRIVKFDELPPIYHSFLLRLPADFFRFISHLGHEKLSWNIGVTLGDLRSSYSLSTT